MRDALSADHLDRLKREMLRQVVQQNIDLIQGRLPGNSPQGKRRRVLPAVAVGLLVPVAVFASAVAWQRGHTKVVEEVAPAAEMERREPMPEILLPAVRPSDDEAANPAETAAQLAAAEHGRLDPAVFPLEIHRVVLDPGHGGEALGTHLKGGLAEKDITLDIGLRLRQILASRGFDVLMTRDRDVDVSLADRAHFANTAGADLFLSIHVNWIADGGESRGVETYYLGTAEEAYVSKLAAFENLDSGYALADLRKLVDHIYTGVRGEKSRDFARAVHGSLYHSLTKVNGALRDRGVKTAPFLVLVETEMPAILAEVSCLSNDREAALLGEPSYRQAIALSLADGLSAFARSSAEVVQKGP